MSILRLMVCPHDTASNPDRWYLFLQYLARRLNVQLGFEVSLDFADFHANLGQADLVYANPNDTVMLLDQGYELVARPANVFDEVVFVASLAIDTPTLESIAGKPLLSVRCMLPTNIALHILKERGIEPAGVIDCESWLSVVGSLWRNEGEFGIVYKDTYNELSGQGKSMVNAFETSNQQVAFHSLVVGREALPLRDDIRRAVLDMHTDDQGKEVLQALHFSQWVAVDADAITQIRHIIDSYTA